MNIYLRIFLFITGLIFIVACKSPIAMDDGNQQTRPTIQQGIWGTVQFWEGDFMPTIPPNQSNGKIVPVERKLCICELTSLRDVEQIPYSPFYRNIHTRFVDTVWSNSKGFFQVSLPEGIYSIFVREDSLYYANSFDGAGYIFSCPVRKDSLTEIKFDITYKATF